MNTAVPSRRPLRAAAALAALVALSVVLGIGLSGGDALTFRVAEGWPAGEDVGLLEPVRLRFDRAVPHGPAQGAVRLTPAVRGSFAWQGETLEFHPDAPGYARNTVYTVTLAGSSAPALSFRTRGNLRVLRHAPDEDEEEVATDTALLVQFNASVQPLTTLAETPNRQVVTIDPPVEGAGSWLTSAMYRFRPAQGWRPSTRYTVRLLDDVGGVEGESMDGALSWSFTTVAPAVADVSPGPNTNQAPTGPPAAGPGQRPPGPDLSLAPANGAITVRFNQPVQHDVAERALSFSPPIGGTPAWPDGRTLVFQPDAPLARGTRYTGTVAAGVPSESGALSSRSAFTWSFTTAGAPAIVSTEPAAGGSICPGCGLTVRFNTPMDKESVEQRVTLAPKPDRDLFFSWEPGETALHIGASTGPSAPYRLSIAAGASDRFGQVIESAYALDFRTAPRTPFLTLFGAGRGGVFLAGGRSRAVVASVNVDGADLALYRIDQGQFAALLNARGDASGAPPGAVSLRRWRVDTRADENRTKVTVVDLGGEAALDTGYYLLTILGPGDLGKRPQLLPFAVTRTHLTLKRSWDELLVWAVDYASGAPLAGLPLEVWDQSGRRVGSGATDAQGLAAMKAPPPDSRERNFLNVNASREADTVFSSTLWGAGGGFPYPASYTGSLTTERPIYRPGETVYYQGVLRRDDDATLSVPPPSLSPTLVVTDSRNRELTRRALKLDDYGAFNGEITLDAEAPSGSYAMHLEQPSGMGVFDTFEVASFRRPEFAVTVKSERTDYEDGQPISVTAGAELFLGAPVVDGAVRWRVTAVPYSFNPPDFPGYSFTDPDDRATRVPVGARLEGRGKTDAKGAFGFSVPADVSGDATSQTFTIEATVTDADNQEVSAQTRVRVHKASVYAGVRPRTYLGTAGRPVTIDLVTVDRAGKPVGGQALSAAIVQRRWNTVKVRDADGQERYESQPVDTPLETQSVTTGGDGRAEVSFTPKDGGFYRVAVSGRDPAGNAYKSAGGVYVTGAGYVPWLVSNDDRLTLVADKKEYKPGEVAHVLVPAPFADAVGLVTLERAGVIKKEVRPFAGNSVVLDIPIERGYVPNVFASVTLFKPASGDNPTPEFRTGTVELPVSAAEQKLSITVTPDRPKLGPREMETFTIKTSDAAGKGVPAELSLALVDEAILSLADDRSPDAFSVLYGQRRLGVQTSAASTVSLDELADRARALDAEGGKGGGGGGGEDDTRTDFRFTAHWEPALRTDADGNGRLTVRMPDTLTTWRLTARGITLDSRAGMADAKIVTSKPLIVRPVAPRFLTAGDAPSLGAIVYNFTEAPVDVQVSLTGDGASVDGGARPVRLEPGGQQTVSWKVTTSGTPGQATGTPGQAAADRAKLRWAATGGELSDAVELTLPIYALSTPEVVASSGAVTDRATEVVRGPGTPGAQASDVSLELWPSLTSALPGTVRYLQEYPYESADLTAGRILTAIGVAGARGEPPSANDLTRWVQRVVAEQLPSGCWGWWRGDPVNVSISAYVMLALAEAQRAGQSVDPGVPARCAPVLRDELDKTRDVRLEMNPNTRAFLLYALTAGGDQDMGRVFALAERRDTLGPEGKALLALAMQRSGVAAADARLKPLLTDIATSATVSAAAAHWDDPVSGPARLTTATRTTAFALWALANADASQPLVDDAIRWLMNERREGRWESTQDSAFSVLALGAVSRARQEGEAAYSYRVTLDDRTVREGRVERAAAAPQDSLVIKDGLHAGDNPLVLTREPANASGRLYYQLSYRYVTPALAIGARDHGVAVAREFLSADGEDRPLAKVKAGDLVKVRVTVLASGSMNFVAVEDFLPAGLEAVDASLKTTSGAIAELQRAEAEKQARLRGGTCRILWRACSSPFTHTDIRDDRVALFAGTLSKGAYEYVYFARATTPGTYVMRPSRVSEVYFPDVWGRTDSGAFVVEP